MLRLFLALLSLVVFCDSLSSQFRQHKAVYKDSVLGGEDPGQPLYLTPYIKSGNIQQGINFIINWADPNELFSCTYRVVLTTRYDVSDKFIALHIKKLF